jgi:exopolysaccharide biosynthesis polyprenyl glycosylphosphotransferase
MNPSLQTRKYILADFLTAAITWFLFFNFRKLFIENAHSYSLLAVLKNLYFYFGVITVPLFWLGLNYFSGYYRFINRKKVPDEISKTFRTTIIGVIILFFSLLLDDIVDSYRTYYISAAVLFGLQFLLTLIPRVILTRSTIGKIHNRQITFKTLIIGGEAQAIDLYKELNDKKITDGNNFIGFINNPSAMNSPLDSYIPCLGTIDKLPEIIKQHAIDEIIIAIPEKEHADISEINSWLGFPDITVKAIPGLHNLLKGSTKLTNIMGTPLIEVSHELMPFWQFALKNFIDISFGVVAILTLSPLYILFAIGIKLSSKGPILFRQERIGKNGKPFFLFKFRSMYVDAEKNGPNLSKPNDSRITPFGKFLRKTKLDEIPNFFNVVMGNMSIVGPRPERQFYIDQIIKISPQYLQLQKIKPGITSLGQVKFGYAENVEQMTRRLRYDLLYLENMSLNTDFLVIYYTLVLLFKGRHI